MTDGALADARVLDLTDALGGYCTKLLAELGADVIKVEPPGGAPGRSRAPFYHQQPGLETSLWWLQFNANKRSVTLDLDTTEGRQLFRDMAANAAILVEDTHPGTMASRGLSYQDLKQVNPGLIYTSITPFGQTGPYAHYRGSDLTGQTMSGMITRSGWREDPPGSMGASQGYNQAGAHAAVGTLMALYHRDFTGEGQHVDVSMHEAASVADTDATTRYSLRKEVLKRNGGGIGTSGLKGTRVWACKGGEVRFQLIGPRAHREWPTLIAWMNECGLAGDLNDEKWQDPFYRVDNLDDLEPQVTRFFMTKSPQELMNEGQSRGILFMAFQTVGDLPKDPQLVERGFFTTLEHPELGESLTYPSGPYRLSETPWALHRRAPRLGEHTADLLQGELGLSNDELVQLKAAGVI